MTTRMYLLGLFVVTILLSACHSDNSNDYLGTWETSPLIPSFQEPGIRYSPTKTVLTLTEKYIYFFDSLPMKYTSKKKGKNITIQIDQDSYFENSPFEKKRYDRGLLSPEILKNILTLTCSTMDTNILECTYPEYWNGSTYAAMGRFRFKKNTSTQRMYELRTVRYKRISAPIVIK